MSYSVDLDGSIAAKPLSKDAPGKAEQAKELADRFLREKMGIQENFEEVKSCYLINTDSDKVSRLVDVLFIRADGTVLVVECRWDSQVSGYYVTTMDAYEETQHAIAETELGTIIRFSFMLRM